MFSLVSDSVIISAKKKTILYVCMLSPTVCFTEQGKQDKNYGTAFPWATGRLLSVLFLYWIVCLMILLLFFYV